ncbi:3-dehydroquinate synthase [Balneolales bacterium ANBcel1]|nr:3-dehydroquinate synthase [Balneolales bacterium ANBcel1]
MHQLPSLKTADETECRFFLFQPLQELRQKALPALAETSDPNGVDAGPIVVVDRNVLAAHRARVESAFPPGICRYFELPPGEGSKSIASWKGIIDFALSGQVRRNTPLVAVGGGVTGDLAGFAAASLLRGLPLYQVPTTLLAMVDSAVGGKTGINHDFGKNTIGAFYHPEAVLFDTEFLDTLPEREWLCGISEVLKYGYIRDSKLLEQGAALANPATREPQLLWEVVHSSVMIKSGIVQEDAREAGKRAWLNFGHTFAHALETLDGYRNINHGEAVYAGMIAALYVSGTRGGRVDNEPLLSLRTWYNLKLNRFESQIDKLVALMHHDKKNRDSSIQLVLLEEPGRPKLERIEDPAILYEAWEHVFRVLEAP